MIKLANYNIVDMDGVATPLEGSTADTATESISKSEPHTSAETMPQGDDIVSLGDSPSTPSRPELNSTPSTGSSNSSSSSTFSIPFDNYSSRAETPLTPPLAEDAGPKGQNPMQCDANPKGEDSKKSIVEILQSVKHHGSSDAVQRPLTPQPEGSVVEFGSGNLVYSSGYSFDFVAHVGHNSPTPKNVSGENVHSEAEKHSARLEVPDVESKDSDPGSETDDMRLIDPRSSKKARRGSSSLTPPRSFSEDAHRQRTTSPYLKDTLEKTASLITLPQGEAVGSPPGDVIALSHKLEKVTPTKRATLQGEPRRSPRIKEQNQKKTNASATTDLNVTYCAPNSNEVAPSQNLWEGVRCKSGAGTSKLNENEASTDEYQASTTSSRAPGSMNREINSDTEAAGVVDPSPINASKEPDVDTTKTADSIKFEHYKKETKSPTDIKIAILNIILQEDKKHSLDNEKGFIYVYKLDSSEGHVKIGKSKQKHGVRVEQWAKCCKLPFERISDPNDKRFLHYGIVEKLVHAELSNKRKTYECRTCKKKRGRKQPEDAKSNHAEWFEVTEPVALEVIERWRGWLIGQQPYGKDGALR